MASIDFKQLNESLLRDARYLLSQWLPGGTVKGSEYVCADLSGSKGTSLSININTGIWCDFATGEKGGDLISLYAAVSRTTQIDAAKRLISEYKGGVSAYPNEARNTQTKDPKKLEYQLEAPPRGLKPFPADHHNPYWIYKNEQGLPLFWIERVNSRDGSKFFKPHCYDSNKKAFVHKHWPTPRPLYNLDKLVEYPNKPVLVVEGEKACDAAEKIFGEKYVCVTWPCGSKSVDKADWSVIKNRPSVLVWPDADDPGRVAAQDICKLLYQNNNSIKYIDTSDLNNGVDAADYNYNFKDMVAYLKPRAKAYEPPIKNEVIESPPPPTDPNQGALTINYNAGDDAIAVFEHDQSHKDLWVQIGIRMTSNGKSPIYNIDNTMRVLEYVEELRGRIWYDTFHYKIFSDWNASKPYEWSDTDNYLLARWMQSNLGLQKMTDDLVRKASQTIAQINQRSEPLEWLKKLKWDNTPRIINFFPEYFDSESNDYTQAVSKNFWISMVARIFFPGCKCDNMVILEGKQGFYKSTALSVIGGPWYVETNEDPSSNNFHHVTQGRLVVEIAELDSFYKAGMRTIKKLVSTATDRFRPPYERTAKDFPRQCIFAGTTNDSHYLKDETGARRFWPIKINSINIDLLKKDREQLFAEAVHLLRQGHKWHEVPESAVVEQEKRREFDLWEDLIEGWLDGRDSVVLTDVAKECLQITPDRLDKKVQMRLQKVMKVLGWEPAGRETRGFNRVRVWKPIDRIEQQSLDEDEFSPTSYSPESGKQPSKLQKKFIKNFAPGQH